MSKFTKVLGIIALALIINVGAAEAAWHGGHGGWHGGGGHGGGFRGGGFGFGIGGYGYPYGYGGYYDDGGCYLVRQRVRTPYGWRLRRVQVCD